LSADQRNIDSGAPTSVSVGSWILKYKKCHHSPDLPILLESEDTGVQPSWAVCVEGNYFRMRTGSSLSQHPSVSAGGPKASSSVNHDSFITHAPVMMVRVSGEPRCKLSPPHDPLW